MEKAFGNVCVSSRAFTLMSVSVTAFQYANERLPHLNHVAPVNNNEENAPIEHATATNTPPRMRLCANAPSSLLGIHDDLSTFVTAKTR